jgi:hypothetical protein
VAKPKSKDDKLRAAAVLRRSFELRGEEHAAGFRFVYQGVLRDLEISDDEVAGWLAAHLAEVDAAIGRKGEEP